MLILLFFNKLCACSTGYARFNLKHYPLRLFPHPGQRPAHEFRRGQRGAVNLGVVVFGGERLGGGVRRAEVGDPAGLAGQSGGPPAGGIDALRKMQGVGVAEASGAQRPMQRQQDAQIVHMSASTMASSIRVRLSRTE